MIALQSNRIEGRHTGIPVDTSLLQGEYNRRHEARTSRPATKNKLQNQLFVMLLKVGPAFAFTAPEKLGVVTSDGASKGQQVGL